MFRRGLRLLHSRSRDSVDQLKALLDEAIRQRQGKPVHMDSFSLRRESPIPRSKPGSPIPVSLSKREEIKKDMERKINMRDDDGLGAKRPRLDSPSAFKSHTPSPTPSLKSESSSRSRKSDESESDTDMNDIAMEIMDGINCTVCKSFEVTPRNRLVECQECHSLYHQECHKPPVTDQDVNDPRLVWYCAKCAKSLKKQTSIVSATGGGTLSGTRGVSGGGMPSMASGSKSGSSLSRPTPSPTKGLGLSRLSPFTNLSSASGRTLGANNGGNSNNGNNKSLSSSSSSSGKSSAPSNSMITAERRMHLMKKKAAAKMAEKRKL